MIVSRILWAIRITHIPTGESITITDVTAKKRGGPNKEDYRRGLRALMSRVIHKYSNQSFESNQFEYDLPDDEPYPNELSRWRKDFNEQS